VSTGALALSSESESESERARESERDVVCGWGQEVSEGKESLGTAGMSCSSSFLSFMKDSKRYRRRACMGHRPFFLGEQGTWSRLSLVAMSAWAGVQMIPPLSI
jgi:hypothetical protein